MKICAPLQLEKLRCTIYVTKLVNSHGYYYMNNQATYELMMVNFINIANTRESKYDVLERMLILKKKTRYHGTINFYSVDAARKVVYYMYRDQEGECDIYRSWN